MPHHPPDVVDAFFDRILRLTQFAAPREGALTPREANAILALLGKLSHPGSDVLDVTHATPPECDYGIGKLKYLAGQRDVEGTEPEPEPARPRALNADEAHALMDFIRDLGKRAGFDPGDMEATPAFASALMKIGRAMRSGAPLAAALQCDPGERHEH